MTKESVSPLHSLHLSISPSLARSYSVSSLSIISSIRHETHTTYNIQRSHLTDGCLLPVFLIAWRPLLPLVGGHRDRSQL